MRQSDTTKGSPRTKRVTEQAPAEKAGAKRTPAKDAPAKRVPAKKTATKRAAPTTKAGKKTPRRTDSDALGTYRKKRDPAKTPEPMGTSSRSGSRSRPGSRTHAEKNRFVIQEHHARSLHWDLRLERGGVLVSWALPKGLPESPDKNHLAVRTEDHPLEYATFEGEIPQGEYGGGLMTIWDRGTYDVEKWSDREVKFTLHGTKTDAGFVLFQTKDRNWMIHRHGSSSRSDPLPTSLAPMLATAGQLPNGSEDWAFEIKWDGVRAILFVEGGRVHAQSRNDLDVTASFPELADLGEFLGMTTCVLDGEIVALGEDGRPSFARLQQRMHVGNQREARRRAAIDPISFVAFDVLYLHGHSLLAATYDERRAQLESLHLSGRTFTTTDSFRDVSGEDILAATVANGLEGVVAKRRSSPYRPGRRSPDWIKVKTFRTQEVVIGGWTDGRGERRGELGALLLGVPDVDGLRYVGKVGTGFSAPRSCCAARRPHSAGPAHQPVHGTTACKRDGGRALRHCDARRRGRVLRVDESPAAAPADMARTTPGQVCRGGRRRMSPSTRTTIGGRELTVSNLDKVLFPQTGFTKGQLIDYYVRIAGAMLPHLKGRPLTMKRFPDGVDAKFFFEKHIPSHAPEWVESVTVPSTDGHEEIPYAMVNDLPTLAWAANLGTIEFHVPLWHAGPRRKIPANPDLMVFDLDPGPGTSIVECCAVAEYIADELEDSGTECFAKSSGSKGLQLYTAVPPRTAWDALREQAHEIARKLESEHRELIVSNMRRSLREGRVLIDWSQNHVAKTTVCVYSVRAMPEPTVSTPVTRDEVRRCAKKKDPRLLRFTTDAVLRRVAKSGDLFAPLASA